MIMFFAKLYTDKSWCHAEWSKIKGRRLLGFISVLFHLLPGPKMLKKFLINMETSTKLTTLHCDIQSYWSITKPTEHKTVNGLLQISYKPSLRFVEIRRGRITNFRLILSTFK